MKVFLGAILLYFASKVCIYAADFPNFPERVPLLIKHNQGILPSCNNLDMELPAHKEMNMDLLPHTVKLFLSPLLAYSLDRVSMHWMENILSYQQKTGEGVFKTFKTLKERKALFKGLFSRSLSLAPARVLTLTTYYSTLNSLVNSNYSVVASSLIAGIFAGIIDATASCPGENFRTRAIFDLPKPSSLKENYRGYWALLARSTGAPIILSGSTLLLYYSLLPNVISNAWFAGLIMGAVSQIITSPCDVIKNDLMAHPKKLYNEAIYNMISSKSLYRGIGIKVTRMSVGSAIVIGVIEYLNATLSK